MTYLSFAGHWLLGVVFAISAVTKLRGRAAFAEFVASTRNLLPSRWRTTSRAVSAVVITLEATVPVLLVLPRLHQGGLGLAVVLLVAFGAGIAGALRRGERTACRCFGASKMPLGRRHLVRNGLLAVVAVLALVSGDVLAAEPVGLAVAGAAASVLALLVIRFDDVIDLFAPIP
ncbi:MauE/DoxX family redox-associated membrane protein [Nonomuraea insulae]|uniref:MauE/DoxX family redox-associated membrane protein n=1 Tax=Nonomuraea insulae TaxID=1616787 RepID=A0ABW1D0A5_9ACTN